MKHFVTTVSLNSGVDDVFFINGTDSAEYDHPIEQGKKLQNGIMVPIKNLMEKNSDEKIRLTVLVNYKPKGSEYKQAFIDESGTEYPDYCVAEEVQKNYKYLVEEFRNVCLCHKKNCETIEHVFIAESVTAQTHFQLMKSLVESFQTQNEQEIDKLYVDVTFGLATTPVVTLLALNYVYHYLPNVIPEAILYVYRDNHSQEKPKPKTIFELSHLFYMNDAFETMAHMKEKPKNPIAFMERMLELDRG